MDKDHKTDIGRTSALEQAELCHILMECHEAYQEDVIDSGMTYENFGTQFFGTRNGCKDVGRLFRLHQPIIEHRFKSSLFTLKDAEGMLKEFGHCNSFFDRSLLDIQLKPIKPKLEVEGVTSLLCQCANRVALFHQKAGYEDMMAILTGDSLRDYGIYNVSHFAYFMKGLERHGLAIQHWQSMVWNLSRIVYKGRYLNQHLISSTVHNLSALKRRPWQYDSIDRFLSEIRELDY